MMRLNNAVANNLGNITTAGNTVIQNQAKSVCSDKSLSNINSNGKKAIAQNASPKNTHTDISMPANSGDSITAPGNGYIVFGCYVHTGGKNTNAAIGAAAIYNQGYVSLVNNTGGGVCSVATPACIVTGGSSSATFGQTAGALVYVTVPCYQSDSITVNFGGVFPISPGPGYVLKYIPRRGG